ncbi:hypothetical protein [Capnocytophaga leadbetteri]
MNLEEIGKYIEWKNKWYKKDNIDLYQYISFNIHPDDILIIGKLLFPETIEIENSILLKENYNYFLYESLKKRYNNSKEIESEINKIYLYDLFAHCTDVIDDKLFKNIGEFIQFSWDIYFKYKFPNKNIVIERISNIYNYGDILSFYTKE